jgi:hypothetical protein
MPFFGKLFNVKNESKPIKKQFLFEKKFSFQEIFLCICFPSPIFKLKISNFRTHFLWNDFLDETAKDFRVTVVVIERNGTQSHRLFLFNLTVVRSASPFLREIKFKWFSLRNRQLTRCGGFTFVVDREIAVDVQDIFSAHDGVHSAF